MKHSEVDALFLLSGIDVIVKEHIENQYWPKVDDYYEVRTSSPWWVVHTPFGKITIGWRKRVIEINWSDTKFKGEITTDNVTKSEVMIHAWSFGTAVQYLSTLSRELSIPNQ